MAESFEWDPVKAAANWRAHRVAFEEAVKVFGDLFSVDMIDDRETYGEERFNILGMCDGLLLYVSYTERGETIRIISARRAERHEQDHYFRENSR